MMTTQPKYRAAMPAPLDRTLFLTDSGLETTLVFQDGMDLPCFASFPLLETPEGRKRLLDYYLAHGALAARHGLGFVLEGVTWRANADWGAKLGYAAAALARMNRAAVDLMVEARGALERPAGPPVLISGNIGPRGDGYDPGTVMTAEEAEAYHAVQVRVLAGTAVDFVSAFTITNTPEAIGVARAAKAAGVPCVISFTVETDGRLPTGERLADAIAAVDAATSAFPMYYMVNCAHPDHFLDVLAEGDWSRLRGVRANASRRSHAELDAATELDRGDPEDLAHGYRRLLHLVPGLRVIGGCCGTDHAHVAAIGLACTPAKAA